MASDSSANPKRSPSASPANATARALPVGDCEALNRALIRAIPDTVFVNRRNGEYLSIHAPDPALLVEPPDKVLHRKITDVLPDAVASRCLQAIAMALDTGQLQELTYALVVDGQERHFEARIAPCGADTALSIVRDITARKRAEEDKDQLETELRQSQKMESIGRLAGGIAHDFNNIMTAVLGFGSMVLDQLGENDPLRHAVEQIVSAGERATNLTRQLLTFSRKQIVEIRILDPNAVIVEMNQLLRRALGEDIELITLLDDEAGCVRMDPGLLQQVIMNLAINARDAMARGGQLTIRTTRDTLDEKFCKTHLNVQPGDYLQLSVRDNGAGMSREVLSHIFEPFFTTKPKGKGTGLGLATVYGIVNQCGGHIEISSELGAGTEIRIWLPRVVTTADTVPVELEEKLQKGTETILVVEDEEVVRDLSCRILRSLGYRVLEAANGKEALELVAKCNGRIDLVFTDVVMPQMGGPEMVENLLEMRPGIKVIYTSGFTESTIVERGVALGKVRLIQKPFTRELLAQRIRRTRDEG